MMPFLERQRLQDHCPVHGTTPACPPPATISWNGPRPWSKNSTAVGIGTGNIYVDPLVQPISTDSNKGVMVLDAVRAIKAEFPEVHITGGLSNISYGLPQRHIINRTFVTLMMDAGMDSAIIDPLDKKIMAAIHTADMLLGHDQFCMAYLKGVRSGAIES